MSQDLQAYLRSRAHLGELRWGPGLALSLALHLTVGVAFFWPRGGHPDLPEEAKVSGGVRVDKMLAKVGLADSVSDAARKIKAGAVEINGQRVKDLVAHGLEGEVLVQVGKHWRRVLA